jgi:2-phospho-L-lactate guanylyltransferase
MMGASDPPPPGPGSGAPVANAWAVIPAKRFTRAKSRLGPPLGDAERQALARDMLAHVVAAARACNAVAGILVATDGDDVARACGDGVAILRDRDEDQERLGDIVDRALVALTERGADAAVVVMGDLPRLRASDLTSLLTALEGADVALAPDRAEWGANALAVRLPAPMPTEFGRGDSFARHLAAAREHGLATIVVRTASLAHDVDAPGDL